MDLRELQEQIERLTADAQEAVESGAAGKTSLEDVKALLEGKDGEPGIKDQIATLMKERDEALRDEEFKSMRAQVTDLQSVIEELKKPSGQFKLGAEDETGEDGKALDPYSDGEHSVFNDIRLANRGNSAAVDRLTKGLEGIQLNDEGKAMTEGVEAQGGYLVRPVIERQLVERRELDNVLRGLCSKLTVDTNAIQLDQLTVSTSAGWVAELAQKPESTGMTIGTITASVFTAAGLVTVSNQLLADSNPAVDQLVIRDLNKRLVALEETAFLSGSGSGQPLGILNTPGLGTTNLSSRDVDDLLIAILDAIYRVEEDHGAPNGILMHPRTWTRIIRARDPSDAWTSGAWIINPAGQGQSSVTDPRTARRGPRGLLWGYPVYTSNRIPTTLGGGTESRVIVGDFEEALILDRQGITVDESRHVHFTTNQTVLRAETRVGFTAARTPEAWNVIGGTGLADG